MEGEEEWRRIWNNRWKQRMQEQERSIRLRQLKDTTELREENSRHLVKKQPIVWSRSWKMRRRKESKSSDDDIHLDTTIDEFKRHIEVTGSNLDRQNLIDLMYNEGCISLLHKQHIKQQPTQQQRNIEMLQLIKNGSIKTFNVALEYFRVTNQDPVFDMLNRKYCSEGNLSSRYWKYHVISIVLLLNEHRNMSLFNPLYPSFFVQRPHH